jgi:hypothetical protein
MDCAENWDAEEDKWKVEKSKVRIFAYMNCNNITTV